MSISYFDKKQPNFKKLLNYGFKKEKEKYLYSQDIMDGDFNLSVEVTSSGKIKTKVVEVSTGEIYILHLVQSAEGTFVGKLRDEYEYVLKDIANKCFETEIFQSPEAKNVIKYVDKKYGDKMEYLWEKFPDNAICRRKDNKKWYLIIMTIKKSKLGFDSDERVEVMNLRALPEDIPQMIKAKNIYPAYHMNKKYWYTILFDGSMDIEEIFEHIDISYKLTLK